SLARPMTAAPCLATSGRISSRRSSSAVTELTSARPSYTLSPASSASITEESMQMGRSTASCTVVSIALSSSGSSTSGMPALTSSMLAPACAWASASAVTVERSPLRSSSANTLRPVGLMRSPMMQKGCSAPIVTLPERDRSTVSIGLSFDSWGDSEATAELGDARVLAEGDEVQAGHARLGQRVGCQLVGDVKALVLGVGRLLDAADGLGRNVDAGHVVGDEAHAADAAQDADRRDQRNPLAQPDVVGRAHEALEQLGAVAELELEVLRAREGFLGGAAHAVLQRGRRRVLHRTDEEVRLG